MYLCFSNAVMKKKAKKVKFTWKEDVYLFKILNGSLILSIEHNLTD